MRNLVGKGEPGGARRKLELDLFYLYLVAIIGLHAVMELKHDMVIFRPTASGNLQELKDGATAGQRPSDRGQKTRNHLLEGLTYSPDAASAFGIDICENS
jgi:hypothetical protein